jgi:acyl carrier protein
MKDQTYLSVCNALATYFEVSPAQVKPDQQLRRDWGVDPVELNVIALRIEEREDVEIRARDLENVDTVGQLIALVRAIRRRNEIAEEITLVRDRGGRRQDDAPPAADVALGSQPRLDGRRRSVLPLRP